MNNFNRKFIIFIFSLTLILKLSTCYYLSYLSNCSGSNSQTSIFASKSGDAASYLDPIDNFIEKGSYFLDPRTTKIHSEGHLIMVLYIMYLDYLQHKMLLTIAWQSFK